MTNEAIEAAARAIWEQQCQHWGRYRDSIPDLCAWEELSESKQRELIREARAAAPALMEEGARLALEAVVRGGGRLPSGLHPAAIEQIAWFSSGADELDMDDDDTGMDEGFVFECAGWNDGTGFYCPLWGSEECDWECPEGGMG